MVFTYMATMLLELVDEMPQVVSLDDKLSKYLPALPESDKISLKNLANMTSGYADYLCQEEVLKGLSVDPFPAMDFRRTHSNWHLQVNAVLAWNQLGMLAFHTNHVILGSSSRRLPACRWRRRCKSISSNG